jgi:N4-gp56 family major capsid protein
MAKITIEETLKASDVATAFVAPYLLYSEVLEGARRPLAFIQVCKEDFSLIGAMGQTIKFPTATQLSASADTPDNILSAGMTAGDKTIDTVDVSVSNIIFCAVELQDALSEEFPNIDWMRMQFRNMGAAVMEYLDADIYSVLAAASGVATASCSSLSYATIVDALAAMENNSWISDEANAPFLLVAPQAASAMLKDSQFTEARRYTTHELSKIVAGEMGLYGGCRVLKSPYLDGKAYAFIVFPPDSPYGPVVVVAWKRRLTVKNEYFPSKEYTYYVSTIRAKAVVVQAKGICKITQTTTP